MTINNNPLKQYFRRPAVHLRLPSKGKYYADHVIDTPPSGELPVYPMTAIDEITVKTPDALFNGSAIPELIKSCVPDIKDPWAINNVDLDAVLISIKAATGSGEMDLDTVCPACEEESKYGLSLIGMLTQLKEGDYDSELIINDLKIKFRPLSYKEMNSASMNQFEVQKLFNSIEQVTDEREKAEKAKIAIMMITDLTMNLLANAIEYIATPSARVDETEYILDFLKNCDKESYNKIKDYHAKLKEDTTIKPLKLTCTSCNHNYEQPFTLNTADFFD
jgi:hypothetical protein